MKNIILLKGIVTIIVVLFIGTSMASNSNEKFIQLEKQFELPPDIFGNDNSQQYREESWNMEFIGSCDTTYTPQFFYIEDDYRFTHN